MFRKLILTSAMFFLLVSFANAVVIVNESFDNYSDDSALEAIWAPYLGNGTTPFGSPVGILVPRPDGDPTVPPAPYDGTEDLTVTPPVQALVGKAVTFSGQGNINEYNDASNPFSLTPTAAEPIHLSADIFDFAEGNRRFSVGLRDDQTPSNLIELGHWQASDVVDPTDGLTPIPDTGYAYRVAVFGAFGGDLVQAPNWQFFQLPIEFDDSANDHNGDGRVGNDDGLVTAIDVGPGWHTYSATISDTEVTLELDLFRDGTVDSSVTWEMTPFNGPFNSLRLGGPSGVSSANLTMVDNILLETLGGTVVDGDFDDNGSYECADVDSLVAAIVSVKNGGSPDLSFDLTSDNNVNDDDLTAWLAEAGAVLTTSGNPILAGDATLDGNVNGGDFLAWNDNKFTATSAWCDGDFNADGNVNGGDFLIWNDNKFTSSDVSAVPEPTGFALILFGFSCLFLRRSCPLA